MLTKQQLNSSEEGIDNSQSFLALVTKDMIGDERCLYEWNYAKNNRKEFILVIKKGIVIPEELLEGVKVVYKNFFSNEEDLKGIAEDIRKLLGKVDFIDNRNY